MVHDVHGERAFAELFEAITMGGHHRDERWLHLLDGVHQAVVDPAREHQLMVGRHPEEPSTVAERSFGWIGLALVIVVLLVGVTDRPRCRPRAGSGLARQREQATQVSTSGIASRRSGAIVSPHFVHVP